MEYIGWAEVGQIVSITIGSLTNHIESEWQNVCLVPEKISIPWSSNRY